ncbi:MAG: TIM barrel protein [Anaerolineaceae bacterium]|nr:TIM barrel protein [Anaerolineaceae bacterium]
MKNSFRFGTVGSPISTPKKPGGSVGALQQISALGLNALELGWVQSVKVKEETCKSIKETAHKLNITVTVHAPYFINLNADQDEWPKSRKRLMDAAYYGNLAGATSIIFHPGSYFGREPAEVLPLVIQRLKECVAELREADNQVILRPETMGKSAMIGSIEDVLEMSRLIEGVEPCLDFAHLHARTGNGSMNTYAEWMTLLEGYANILGTGSLKGLHIHLSGIEYTEKGEKKHLPVRECDFNLFDLYKALRVLNCGGTIVCESPLMEEDALFLRDSWLLD